MYKLDKVSKLSASQLNTVATILNKCGKDMAQKYDLHHWDNQHIKSLIIVIICSLKNEIYLISDEIEPVATFMTQKRGSILHFEKLGTLPSKSGKGIGSLCMTKIEEIAKSAGCKKVSMEVYAASERAISFYEHRGYTVVGTTDTLKYKEVKMEKGI